MAKMSRLDYQVQTWVQLRKYYINCGYTSETNICMADVQRGYLSACRRIFPNCQFWLSYYLLKNVTN